MDRSKKAAILTLFLKNQDEGFTKEIMERLDYKQATKLLDILRVNPVYEEENVHHVLDEFRKMAIDRTLLFPDDDILGELQSHLDYLQFNDHLESKDHLFQFLHRMPKERVVAILKNNPPHLTALICYFMDKDSIGPFLDILPKGMVQHVMQLYLEVSPPTDFYLIRLHHYLQNKLTEELQKSNSKNTRKLVRILELTTPTFIDKMIQTIEQSANVETISTIKENLMTIDDITQFSQLDGEKIIAAFNELSDIASLQLQWSDDAKTKISSLLSERYLEMLEEEVESVRANMSDEAAFDVRKRFISTIRELQDAKEITKVKDEF